MGHEKFVISDNKNSLYSVQKKTPTHRFSCICKNNASICIKIAAKWDREMADFPNIKILIATDNVIMTSV